MTTRNDLFRTLLVLLCLAGGPAAVSAQIRDPRERLIPTTRELRQLRRMLHESVHLNTFRGPLTLKQALEQLYEQLSARGVELAMLVDQEAFREESRRLDIYEIPVRIPSTPRRVSVREFLKLLLEQIPSRNATLAFRPSYIEITTVRKDAQLVGKRPRGRLRRFARAGRCFMSR